MARRKQETAIPRRDEDLAAPRPTMNPLGRTGASIRPPDMTRPEDDPDLQRFEEIVDAQRHAEQQRSVVSMLMLVLGGILSGVGVGFWVEWSAGLATFGVLTFTIGVLFGLSA